jgi:hypothetical protein
LLSWRLRVRVDLSCGWYLFLLLSASNMSESVEGEEGRKRQRNGGSIMVFIYCYTL